MSGEKKKMDPAITTALITGVFTVVVALISSPIWLEYFKNNSATETAVAAPTGVPGATEIPTVTSTPPGSAPGQTVLSFEQDFETNTSGFAFPKGEWKLAKDKGNGVLEGNAIGLINDVANAVFGPSDFSNGLIEFQVLFKDTEHAVYLNFRDLTDEAYVLYLAPIDQQIALGYNGVSVGGHLQPFSEYSEQAFTFEADMWYAVQVEALDSSFTVWVDENRLFTATDERLAQGRIVFAIDDGGTVLIDNVIVWEYVK